MSLDSYILKIKRAETPFHARLKGIAKSILNFQLPIPRALDPVYTFIRHMKYLSYEADQRVSVACFRFPVLRSMCVSIGKRLRMELIPNITGAVQIYIGDDVYLSGQLTITGGRIFPDFSARRDQSVEFGFTRPIEASNDMLVDYLKTVEAAQ